MDWSWRILGWLLNLVYATVLLLALPYLLWKAWFTGKYRQGWLARLWGQVPRPTGDQPRIWLHAVSVGEVNLLPTLVAPWLNRHPDWQVIVTSTTQTGVALARQKFPHATVSYCPLDFTWSVRRALARFQPSMLVLAELELWPNLILAAHARGIPVAVVNGRLSEHSHRGYRRLLPLMQRLLTKLDFLAVQSEEDAQRFLALGAPAKRTRVTGSIKFDGALTERQHPRTQTLRELAGYGEDPVFLAGSTGGPEEAMVLQAYAVAKRIEPRLRLILVPRHLERISEIEQLLKGQPNEWVKRSQLTGSTTPPDVLLVDVVGELSAWWGVARVGFVGGTFYPRGGQNMIEPAGFGVATCYGPDYRNFRDVVARFQQAHAQVIVQDQAALTSFVVRCVQEPAYAATLGERARRVVLESQGATVQTLAGLEALLPRKLSAEQIPQLRAAG